ncbi:MAG: tetratricopeptide repeat protein [Moraxella sp.]|uniref:YfgM family protein n=1 Tax=Moraxella sp. TaxID=479 RepID=UPI0026DD2E0C|nr:tetratricopeptide repeat protein [Moraxella sp.]MDO4451158.1 tetratricopeptide repeat protein [Moraxella sp.]
MNDELVVNDKQAMSALKKHGGNIVWAIIVVLAGFFGFQYYQKNYAKIDTAAADSYLLINEKNEALMSEVDTGADVSAQKQTLFADVDKLAQSNDGIYAWQALMIKARHQSDDGQYDEAVATLKQAIAIDLDDKGLTAISQLRLAQVLLASDKSDEALSVVGGDFPSAFDGSKQELLGDIYVAKNDVEGAKKAYQMAWDSLAERGENRSLLSLKMQSLGMNPAPITPKNQVVATPSLSEDAAKTAEVLPDTEG